MEAVGFVIGLDAVVYISLFEKSNDVGSPNWNGDDGFLLAGEHEGKNEFKSFDGETDVNSRSKELIGDETLPWFEWTTDK